MHPILGCLYVSIVIAATAPQANEHLICICIYGESSPGEG